VIELRNPCIGAAIAEWRLKQRVVVSVSYLARRDQRRALADASASGLGLWNTLLEFNRFVLIAKEGEAIDDHALLQSGSP
jgi:hypothetical protein